MVFGVSEPAGSTVFEVPLTAEDYSISWGELQHDIGVDGDVRLYMAMLARRNPTSSCPTTWAMCSTPPTWHELQQPGGHHHQPADRAGDAITTETESNGRVRTTTEVVPATQKAGVPFEICFVAENNGGDGT